MSSFGTVPYGTGTYGPGVLGGLATITVDVAFTTDPGDASPVWEDVSAYVKALMIHGASRQREVDRFQAGYVDVVFDNADGRFHPNNPDSPYYPNVVPMRRIRVRATWAAVVYDLFDGYVEDWPPTSAKPEMAITTIKATDGFMALAAAPFGDSAYEAEVRADEPVAWWRLSDSDPLGQMTDSAGSFDGRYEDAPTMGQDALAVGGASSVRFAQHSRQRGRYLATAGASPVSAYPYTIEALIKVDRDDESVLREIIDVADQSSSHYGLECKVIGTHSYWLGPVSGTLGATLRGRVGVYATSSGQVRSLYSNVNVDDGAVHHVAVVATSATDIKILVDGVDQTVVYQAGSPVFPTAPLQFTVGGAAVASGDFCLNGLAAEAAVYDVALSTGRIAAHSEAALTGWAGDYSGERVTRILDAAGWPAALRDIDDGQSTLQAQSYGTALDALQAIADSELGAVYCMPDGTLKFRDRHALLKAPYTTSAAEFSDQATGVRFETATPDFAVDLIRNVARVGRSGGPTQRATNQASIDKYFERKYDKTGLILERDGECRDQAQFIVNRYPEPPFRYGQLKLNPVGIEDVMFPLIFGLAIGDRITVTDQPPGFAAPDSRDMHIDGITHEIVGVQWRTTLQLSPVDDTSYFVLGTSTLGGSDVLGY